MQVLQNHQIAIKFNKNEHSEYEWLSMDEAIDKLNPKDGFENEKKEMNLYKN